MRVAGTDLADDAERLPGTGSSLAALFPDDAGWSRLDRFHDDVLAALGHQREAADRAEAELLAKREEYGSRVVAEAMGHLCQALAGPADHEKEDLSESEVLFRACEILGSHLGIAFKRPPADAEGRLRTPLDWIARVSRIRVRPVTLEPEWWKNDSGSLLGWLEKEHRPVALVCKGAGKYVMHDPVTGQRAKVDAALASGLKGEAHMFYRRFPERALGIKDLLTFAAAGRAADMRAVVVYGSAMGLLALAVPFATQILYGSVLPLGQRDSLYQVITLLVVATAASAVFQIAQSVAIIRFEGRFDYEMAAAMMDRVISLPPRFYRRYSIGDLGQRAMGVGAITQILMGSTMINLLRSIFAVFSFALLFYYDHKLALAAGGMILTLGVFLAYTSLVQLRYQRQATDMLGRMSGTVFQLVSGVAKFRLSGNEARAYALLAHDYGRLMDFNFKASVVEVTRNSFGSAFPTVCTVLLFGMLTLSHAHMLSTGEFLAFLAAFSQCLSAAQSIGGGITDVVSAMPYLERMKPILDEVPEVDEVKMSPGVLLGGIEVKNLSFRYQQDGPLILDDVSLRAEPGEYVALVGLSGAGKSTVLRQLLGFEKPEQGGVFYDGKDLGQLDVLALRQQLGVVLQDQKIFQDTVYRNIVGSQLLTLDDAWEAARMVGLDADIRNLPSGMDTIVSEMTLSGGQCQRIFVARALVSKPPILLFDEATSALDNETQAVVTRSLDQLKATRIVIAHYLSTVVKADRLYVLEGGRVVQQGTFDQLMKEEGLFQELARRQLVAHAQEA